MECVSPCTQKYSVYLEAVADNSTTEGGNNRGERKIDVMPFINVSVRAGFLIFLRSLFML